MKWFWDKIVKFVLVPRTHLNYLGEQVDKLQQEVWRLRGERNELTAALAREVETNMLLSDTLAAIDGVNTSEERNEDMHCANAPKCAALTTAQNKWQRHIIKIAHTKTIW